MMQTLKMLMTLRRAALQLRRRRPPLRMRERSKRRMLVPRLGTRLNL